MYRPGFWKILFSAFLVAMAIAPAVAQDAKFAQPPDKLPKVQRGQDLDFLFGALKAAPDAETAKAVEGRIWAVWVVSNSDTVNLLMTRVRAAVDGQKLDLAVQLLDKIVVLRPDYVEAWNRRATIQFMRKDYNRSIEDIRQVLAREPRHFGALSGLGMIMQELGDDKRALEVYRKAIEINPQMQRLPDLIKTLSEKVEGRDI
jgi:tetratricopeptide (TPR) repeat protein